MNNLFEYIKNILTRKQWVGAGVIIAAIISAFIDMRFTAGIVIISVGYWFFFNRSAYGRVGKWLGRNEWLWSVPVGLLAFWFIGYIMQEKLGLAAGTYDFTFLQPFFLSQVIATLIFAGAQMSIRMHWPALFKWWNDDEKLKIEFQEKIETWQRLLYLYLVFFSYTAVTLIIYYLLV